MHQYYLSYGGGLGDVVWEYLRDKRAWWVGPLVKDYGARIRVYTMCHNDGVDDVFRHHPFIEAHFNEPWQPPTVEIARRFSEPIDGYLPLHHDQYVYGAFNGVLDTTTTKPALYLSHEEQHQLASLVSQRPCIVLQPFAGLSDRDAFNSVTLQRLTEKLVSLCSSVRIIVVGKNHERTHKYNHESVGFEHPNVTDMIDRLGIRLGYHLVRHCDAFCGSHSNLIRTAWDWRRRNACVMPAPMMTDALPRLDPKYCYGFKFPETRMFTFPFGDGVERDFSQLDTDSLATFLLGR